jgi:hypothetical protein
MYSVLAPSSSQSALIRDSPIVAPATCGSCHASSAVAIVCSRLETNRWSAPLTDWIASIAGVTAFWLQPSSSFVGSSNSEVAIQCRTLAIVRSVALVAANRSAAR